MINMNEKELEDFSSGKSDSSNIPNIIWTFWEGDDNTVVHKCIESWKYYNPEYDIRILNKSNYSKYTDIDIDSIPHSKDSMARYSDYIRCLMLSKYGGFWIDASIICHHPFSWVHGIQKTKNVDFIGYYFDGFTQNHLFPVVESWFFACTPNSSFMHDWSDEFSSTMNHKTIDDYLENINQQNIDLQKIDVPNYLAIHVAAQKILQQNIDKYNICLFKAESGPFYYLNQSDWDSEKAVKYITDKKSNKDCYKYTFVKLRGSDRQILEKYDAVTIDNAFSHNKQCSV
jgi:hypothetical protein